MSSPTRRRSQALEVPEIDWLDLLISTVGGISTILSAASIPWISAPAEIVLKLLRTLKVSHNGHVINVDGRFVGDAH